MYLPHYVFASNHVGNLKNFRISKIKQNSMPSISKIHNFFKANEYNCHKGLIKKIITMKIDKFTIQCTDLESLIRDINREVENLSKYTDNSGKMIVLVAERFYFRIGSYLAVTIIFDRINQDQYKVVIVVAGGKHDLLEFDWGAAKSMLKRIKNLIVN